MWGGAAPADTASACASGSASPRALLGDPPALMLDEPFNGMDPEGIIWMRTFLRDLAREGRAVLVSSHLMSELQGTADHIVVVGRGRVIADAGVTELLAGAANGRITVRSSAIDRALGVLRPAAQSVTSNGDGTLTVTGPAAEDVVALLTDRPYLQRQQHADRTASGGFVASLQLVVHDDTACPRGTLSIGNELLRAGLWPMR
ncbi:hypothetical protein GCM10020218_056050 [Dactylosporangium vinaceum]